MKSSRTCRGQILKAKAKADDKSSRTRTRTKFWPRGQLVLEDLTSVAKPSYIYPIRPTLFLQISRSCLQNLLPHRMKSAKKCYCASVALEEQYPKYSGIHYPFYLLINGILNSDSLTSVLKSDTLQSWSLLWSFLPRDACNAC